MRKISIEEIPNFESGIQVSEHTSCVQAVAMTETTLEEQGQILKSLEKDHRIARHQRWIAANRASSARREAALRPRGAPTRNTVYSASSCDHDAVRPRTERKRPTIRAM